MQIVSAFAIFAAMTPERKQRIENVLSHRQPDLAVLLENVHDPHNISAVMRTCDSVGVQEVYVLNTRIPRHKKFGSKSSASAASWLTIHQFEKIDECFSRIRAKYDKIFATHLGASSASLYELDLTEKVVLVFGNEHSGVSDEVLELCDGNFLIPQVGMVKSLNISVACAVSLYEAYRQRAQKGYYDGLSRMGTETIAELSSRWEITQ